MFIARPLVILKILCILFSLIIFYCIKYSHHGWHYSSLMKREVCLFNDDPTACNFFGLIVPEFTFVVALVTLICEYFYEEIGSSKGKKSYFICDVLCSGTCAILYIIGTPYLVYQFSSFEEDYYSISATYGFVKASIIFSFFSIITWVWSAYITTSRLVASTNIA